MNCKEATLLTVRSEFESLSIIQRLSLWYHLIRCTYCRHFKTQSAALNESIKKNTSQKSFILPLERKADIIKQLDEIKK